ncbi:Glutamate receptor ionotropic, NMDA 2B, partial [Orchesella cincta]
VFTLLRISVAASDTILSDLPDSSGGANDSSLYVGMILPYTIYQRRGYIRQVNYALNNFKRQHSSEQVFSSFFNISELQKHVVIRMISFSPSPQDIETAVCEITSSKTVSAIIYLNNNEMYTNATATSQYLFQLAGRLGLPVIAWNADNSGFQRINSGMVLQMAPSIDHQVGAMLSILKQYQSHQFAIVTSQIAGHEDFVQVIQDIVFDSSFKFEILTSILVHSETDLLPLVDSGARIVLLYCTKEEAIWIMKAATTYGLTGAEYNWIVTQSVVGDNLKVPYYPNMYQQLPVGMIAIRFNTTLDSLKEEIGNALGVFVNGALDFRRHANNNGISLTPNQNASCEGIGDQVRWSEGERFYRTLRNVSVRYPGGSRPPLRFNSDGTIMNVELQIMILRSTNEKYLKWEQVGIWHSWNTVDNESQLELDIDEDIVWLGTTHKPIEEIPLILN